MIVFNHTALVCRSESNCDRFFVELLGLEKTRSRDLEADVAEKIFGRRKDFRFIDYSSENTKFEIFIDPEIVIPENEVHHVCLDVPDIPLFLNKARQMGLEIREIDFGGKVVVFIKDFDGHPYEIKSQK